MVGGRKNYLADVAPRDTNAVETYMNLFGAFFRAPLTTYEYASTTYDSGLLA